MCVCVCLTLHVCVCVSQAASLADYHRAKQGLPPGGYQEVQFALLDGERYANIVKHEGIRGYPSIRLYRCKAPPHKAQSAGPPTCL